MHPLDCPGWEYEDHPDHEDILPRRCQELLLSLRRGELDPHLLSRNTREAHQHLFVQLTPDECDYFAGHYRGENFRCLQFYNVQILSDPRVGADAGIVFNNLNYLAEAINNGIAAIDLAYQKPEAQIPKWQKVLYLVTFSTRILVEFLRIHPYANGNGHMARFIIFALLARYNIWPKRWPLDESPDYHQLISDYRDGNPILLERFILSSVLGN